MHHRSSRLNMRNFTLLVLMLLWACSEIKSQKSVENLVAELEEGIYYINHMYLSYSLSLLVHS